MYDAGAGECIRMPTYHFQITHSEEMRDEAGIELESLHSAKCHAVQMIADLLFENPSWFWESERFGVTVSDSSGSQLLTVQMVATWGAVLLPPKPMLRSR